MSRWSRFVCVSTGFSSKSRTVCNKPWPERGKGIFSSPERSNRLWGPPTLLPIKWVKSDPSPKVKKPGREADHSLPFSIQVKSRWSYTSTPPHTFMAYEGTTLFNVKINNMISLQQQTTFPKVHRLYKTGAFCTRVFVIRIY
jgi:hypothetical protein